MLRTLGYFFQVQFLNHIGYENLTDLSKVTVCDLIGPQAVVPCYLWGKSVPRPPQGFPTPWKLVLHKTRIIYTPVPTL